jgi:ATP-dependent phosphofructokinase / diphosphate-dependent phosphofructokinase
MARKNAFYAQSGGVSAVINASACGVLQTARQHSGEIGKVYAGRNGIVGALTEDLIDTSVESEAAIVALKHTPGAAFGSCRYKLASIQHHRAQYDRLIEVFHAHDIGFFFYNGGGDSQDTAYKVSLIGTERAYPIVSVGIPKTVDNDLPITDCSPGFGSAAKYVVRRTERRARAGQYVISDRPLTGGGARDGDSPRRSETARVIRVGRITAVIPGV